MKLFLDTASVKEIRTMWEIGILDGVTTNPTLVAKEGRKFEEVLREICALGVPSVSAEVVATDTDGMLAEGRRLREIHPAIYVKAPMTPAGLRATKILAGEGTRVNMTLVFSAPQALLAAKVGAAYVSPFIGRLDDQGEVGMEPGHRALGEAAQAPGALVEVLAPQLPLLQVRLDAGERPLRDAGRGGAALT